MEGKKKIILTGDRPTGKLHIGHYVGSLRHRVELQNSGKYDEIYVMIADAQALTDNADNPDKIRNNILNIALDYLSAGIDPSKTHIFTQSSIPALAELNLYYLNLVTVSRLQRNPTVKAELQMRDFEASIPAGFFTYPVSQAADITAFLADTVPVGEDQIPMLEQACEIVHKFNSIYGDVLVEPKALLPKNKACMRLVGTDGKAKMSKSLGNCIYLSDDRATLKVKIKNMFTDPNHLKITDPGNTKDNPVFIYLTCFANDEDFKKYLPEYKNLDEMKAHYEAGGLGDNVCKDFLFNVLDERLTPIREKRHYYEEHLEEVYEILREGTIEANKKANETLKLVRHAMRIDYYDDKTFVSDMKSRLENDESIPNKQLVIKEELKKWRKNTSKETGVQSIDIINETQLEEIVNKFVCEKEELKKLGIKEEYIESISNVVNRYK